MNSPIDAAAIKFHETSVRALIPLPKTGKILLSGLPGLEINYDGGAYLDPPSCELTFALLQHHKTKMIYILMEEHEVPGATVESVNKIAETFGVETRWMPIIDFDKPEATFENEWRAGQARRASILSEDGAICMCCLYGAGRSGMMAAALAVEAGVAPEKAVSYLRTFFEEAVGSPAQEKWVVKASYL